MPVLGPADLVVAVVLAVATFTDLRSRRVPNVLTFGALAVALLVRGVEGQIVSALLGTVAAFVPGFILWQLGGAMRAGDVKLLMALGAIYGPGDIFRIYLLTFAIFIPVALVMLLVHGRLRTLVQVIRTGVRQSKDGPKPLMMPFVPVIAAGVLLARLVPDLLRFW